MRINSTLSRIALAVVLLSVFLSPAACRKEKVEEKKSLDLLSLIQQNKSISVSLKTLSAFTIYGNNDTVLTEFAVKGVPITWTGTMFEGSTFEDAAGIITDYVHGTVSEDGMWIESMSFSQKQETAAMRRYNLATNATMGLFFEYTLRNIPIAENVSGNLTGVGIFDKTGDIKKHVVKIEYEHDGFEYISTDWINVIEGQSPILKINFDKEAPARSQKLPGMPMR